MKTKLAAFTIVELIAVLLLSGFIFTIAMLVIQIMQQQERRQEIEHKEVLEITQLQSLLKKDANQSKTIWVDNQQLFFDYDTYTIKYLFDKKYICRSIIETTVHNDTFLLPTLSFDCQWQGQTISTGKTDAVAIKSEFFKQPFDLIITKRYDHKTLLEL